MNPPRCGTEVLAYVYYRVADVDLKHVIPVVREFQRTLPDGVVVIDAQVLLRCDLPPAASSSDASHAPSSSSDSPPAVASTADRSTDATVMEIYRLALPPGAGSAAAEPVLCTFLDTLAAAASPLDGLLRGVRHVELFAPCAS
jgi:hypothetical protein